MAQRLFSNAQTNITSGSFIKQDIDLMSVFAWGVFDGASISLQFSPDGVEWFDDPTAELVFTEKTIRTQRVTVGAHVRAVITGAGASTNVTLMVL